jgi:hypothetical protein
VLEGGSVTDKINAAGGGYRVGVQHEGELACKSKCYDIAAVGGIRGPSERFVFNEGHSSAVQGCDLSIEGRRRRMRRRGRRGKLRLQHANQKKLLNNLQQAFGSKTSQVLVFADFRGWAEKLSAGRTLLGRI